MNIYLAARFNRWPEMQVRARELSLLGHVVVSRWHSPELIHRAADDHAPSLEQQSQWAMEDLVDVRNANMLIAFTEPPRSIEGGRGGRHVELGIAIGLSRDCIVIGPREHIFHCLPFVDHFDTWEEFIQLPYLRGDHA